MDQHRLKKCHLSVYSTMYLYSEYLGCSNRRIAVIWDQPGLASNFQASQSVKLCPSTTTIQNTERKCYLVMLLLYRK